MCLFKNRNSAKREPWNKGELTGQKPLLQPKQDWATKEETVIWDTDEPKDFPTNFEILDGPGMH